MMKRLHLEVVLRDAAAAAGLPTQPHAPRALEKAHVRLATHYLAAGEHALCKAHLDEVLRGRAAYAWYAHAPLDAAFYRRLAVCECELHLRDTALLELPFARDEAVAAALDAKRAKQRLQRERAAKLVAAPGHGPPRGGGRGGRGQEAERRRRAKNSRPKMGLSRAEREAAGARRAAPGPRGAPARGGAARGPADAAAVGGAARARGARGTAPSPTGGRPVPGGGRRAGGAARARGRAPRGPRGPRTSSAWGGCRRGPRRRRASRRCSSRRAWSTAARAGAAAAAAAKLGTAIEFFPRRPGYRRACFRAALAAWRARRRGDAGGAARARDPPRADRPAGARPGGAGGTGGIGGAGGTRDPGGEDSAPAPAPEPPPAPAPAPAPAAAEAVDEAPAPTPPPPPEQIAGRAARSAGTRGLLGPARGRRRVGLGLLGLVVVVLLVVGGRTRTRSRPRRRARRRARSR